MQFMITFNHIDGVWERLNAQQQADHNQWLGTFIADLASEKNSELVFLTPAAERTTVRKHDGGELEVCTGPAIAGPEQVGGYYIITADSLDEAISWAKKGRWLVGSNEIREIFTLPAQDLAPPPDPEENQA
jgi:hypothetical protein